MKDLMKHLSAAIVTWIIVGFAVGSGYGATIKSITTGKWSAATTWDVAVPSAADSVIITNGDTVTVDISDAACSGLRVGNAGGSGTLAFDSGSQLTVSRIVNLGSVPASRKGSVDMTAGGTLICNAIKVTNLGTWTPGKGTIQFNETNTLNDQMNSFGNLIIGGGTTTIEANTTVNGTLTFVTGLLATGTYTLMVDSIDGANPGSYVNGNLLMSIPVGTQIVRKYEVGDTRNYAPVIVTINDVSDSGSLTVKTTGAEHPNIRSSGLDSAKDVNRYWLFTNNSITFDHYDASFNWQSSDVDDGADTSTFNIAKYTSSMWALVSSSEQKGTSITGNGLTTFGGFAVGEIAKLPINAIATNGTINPKGMVSVEYGFEQNFTYSPNPGYHFDSVVVDNIARTDSQASYTFKNVTSSHTIHAFFSINKYTIKLATSAGGTINPPDSLIFHGFDRQFSFIPNDGYYVDSVFIDGALTDSIASYTFTQVNTNHTIRVVFKISMFTITGTVIQTAGTQLSDTIRVMKSNGKVNTSVNGYKSLIFSGAHKSPDAHNPTVEDDSLHKSIIFGTATKIRFQQGIAYPKIVLAKAETTKIGAQWGSLITLDSLQAKVSHDSLGKFTFNLSIQDTNGIPFGGHNELTAKDNYGNVFNSGSIGTVVISSNPPFAGKITIRPGRDSTLADGDFSSGVATLTGLTYAGVADVSGTFVARTSRNIRSLSNEIDITHGPLRHFLIGQSDLKDSITTKFVDSSFTIKIIAGDTTGNPVSELGDAVSMKRFQGGVNVTTDTLNLFKGTAIKKITIQDTGRVFLTISGYGKIDSSNVFDVVRRTNLIMKQVRSMDTTGYFLLIFPKIRNDGPSRVVANNAVIRLTFSSNLSFLGHQNHDLVLQGMQLNNSVDFLLSKQLSYPDSITDIDTLKVIPASTEGQTIVSISVISSSDTYHKDDTLKIPSISLHTLHPGDADGNGIVDVSDLLAIGLNYYQTGPPRDSLVPLNRMQVIPFGWVSPLIAMADCNGDGVIEAKDVLVIYDNFGNTDWNGGDLATPILRTPDILDQFIAAVEKFPLGEARTFTLARLNEYKNSSFALPKEWLIEQNYPNPFNGETIIRYSVPKSISSVRIVVYDILGRIVRIFVRNDLAAGNYQLAWNGLSDNNVPVATGVYFYRIEYPISSPVKKLFYIK
jgi:hypothetical protein